MIVLGTEYVGEGTRAVATNPGSNQGLCGSWLEGCGWGCKGFVNIWLVQVGSPVGESFWRVIGIGVIENRGTLRMSDVS